MIAAPLKAKLIFNILYLATNIVLMLIARDNRNAFFTSENLKKFIMHGHVKMYVMR